jgi:hypothetical protein
MIFGKFDQMGDIQNFKLKFKIFKKEVIFSIFQKLRQK